MSVSNTSFCDYSKISLSSYRTINSKNNNYNTNNNKNNIDNK